jgi:hypothetical protein
MGKVLVLYVFHEYNDRVDHFLKNAVFYDPNVTFVIIINNPDLKINAPPYVNVLTRKNIGYDFGGWSDALYYQNMYRNFDHFIFVNSSVVGPFLDPRFSGRWTDLYVGKVKDDVKLFGSTINTCKKMSMAHVQSYIFATDREAVEHLMECGIFSTTNYSPTFQDAIYQKEVLMSRKVLERGWNIGCFMNHYKNCDFRQKTIPVRLWDDVMFPNLKNVYWTEQELVFAKGNRIPSFHSVE